MGCIIFITKLKSARQISWTVRTFCLLQLNIEIVESDFKIFYIHLILEVCGHFYAVNSKIIVVEFHSTAGESQYSFNQI